MEYYLYHIFGGIFGIGILILFLLANVATTAYLFKFKPNIFKVSVVKAIWLLFGGVVFIYGCMFGYMYYTFSERQKAYDLKEQCSMNGLGNGKCIFTNLGNSSSHKCGKIVVSNESREDKSSAIFCSGEIPPKDTKNVEFTVIGIQDHCPSSNSNKKWNDACSFSFEAISDK